MTNRRCSACNLPFSSETPKCPYCGSKDYEEIIDKELLEKLNA